MTLYDKVRLNGIKKESSKTLAGFQNISSTLITLIQWK